MHELPGLRPGTQHHRPSVEGRVLDRADPCERLRRAAHSALDPPPRRRQVSDGTGGVLLRRTMPIKDQAKSERRAVATRYVVAHLRRAVRLARTRPLPGREGGLERFTTRVAVEVALTRPAQRRRGEIEFDAGARGDRLPVMPALRIERNPVVGGGPRLYADRSTQSHWPRCGDLIHVDHERVVLPPPLARPDGE